MNLFEHTQAKGETFDTLLETDGLRLERIVSRGQPGGPNDWYDQDRPEWVALLQGEAVLAFDPGEPVTLRAGDTLLIPAHRPHRVASVSDDALWLALHFK
ncbi:MAG: cupin domain-containing protein [Verrucomicrobia bacterium]|nr:cupin domain-containing protein [Verrucomicrobiota bacterium]MCH8510631.1 cupin domain-containing protein [Kiritimatiellia bacterium]